MDDKLDSESHPQSQSLKRTAISGGLFTMGGRGIQFAIRIASTAILARLLTPEDFGLIGMVAPLTGFVVFFKDLGLSTATIQSKHISFAQVSNLFWINVSLGMAITALVFASAPLVSVFYGDPRLTQVTMATCVSIFASTFSIQHQALLRRQMRFGTIATIEIASNVIGVVAGLIFAVLDFRYWSLILMQAVTAFAFAALAWTATRWIPSLPDRTASVRAFVRFGGNIAANDLIYFASQNLDNILIGRYFGAPALGLYNKAYQLLLLPIQQFNAPIGTVALPALSRLQESTDKFRSFYLKAVDSIASISTPIIVLIYLISDEVVLLLLGEQWIGSVELFEALIPAALMSSISAATRWINISLGNSRKYLHIGVLAAATNMTAIVIGLNWGPLGVAYAISISRVITKLPLLAYAYHDTPVQLLDFIMAVRRSTIATVAGTVAFIAVKAATIDLGEHVAASIAGLTFAIIYLSIYISLRGGRELIASLAESVGFKGREDR